MLQFLHLEHFLNETFSPESASWMAYVGTYVDFDTLTIRLVEDDLFVASKEECKDVPCIALDNTLFASELGLIEFERRTEENVWTLRFQKTFTFTHVGDPM